MKQNPAPSISDRAGPAGDVVLVQDRHRDSDPPEKCRRLAADLRRLREQSGHTAETVAKLLGWSKAKVSRHEAGPQRPAAQ